MSPDCDVFQVKCNAVSVAQMLTVESYISINNPKAEIAHQIRVKAAKGSSTNPGAFDERGLLFLPGDPSLGFEDSLVLLENHVSLPIERPSGVTRFSPSFEVTEDSVGGQYNLWFQIKDDPLRIRLVNEFVRLMLRVGLEDA